MTIPTLIIPDPPAGAQGLVLAVNGVSAAPHGRPWFLVTLEGELYRLPADLWPWAQELEARTGRRECLMPAVFMFRRTPEGVAVKLLSLQSIGG